MRVFRGLPAAPCDDGHIQNAKRCIKDERNPNTPFTAQ
jgi:hypothetical protein